MYVRTEMCHVHGKSSPYQHHTYEKHYIDCLKIKLGLDRSQGNPTYTTTTLSKEEIIDNHISVLSSFVLYMRDEYCDLLLLYWIPRLHKCPTSNVISQELPNVHANNAISQELPNVHTNNVIS